jgi:hypothetical protein
MNSKESLGVKGQREEVEKRGHGLVRRMAKQK